jgi:Na+/melibiose symporter-like transporter
MLIICVYLLWNYPLTEKRIAEIQAELARRKAAAGD